MRSNSSITFSIGYKIISKIFDGKRIAFLAKTNAALNNIKIRVGKEAMDSYEFYTVDKFVDDSIRDSYDLVVVDECSMVENDIMLQMLEKNNYDCLLLVGDIYQIEAIEFGNWFRFAKELIPEYSYELTENFRTTNNGLKKLWSKVRNLDDGITEKTIDEAYSEILSESIFENREEEEIVLCLNYDGPYGINNINRYLQMTNKNDATVYLNTPNITYKTRIEQIYDEFKNTFYNRGQCSVYTPWGTYNDMYIQSLDVSQDEQKNIIDISVTYKQLSFANVEYGKVDETIRAMYNEQARAEQENCGKADSNMYKNMHGERFDPNPKRGNGL